MIPLNLDPETERAVWACAERIAALPRAKQASAPIVAISALLSEQSPETIEKVFAAVKAILGDYQRSQEFAAKKSKARPS